MIESAVQLERELVAKLAGVAANNVTNRLSAARVRDMTAEFRREIDGDQAAHGLPIGEPDWNLLMSDANRNEDAVFVATLFDTDIVTFIVGREDASAVRRLCDQFTLGEVSEFRRALATLTSGFENQIVAPRSVAQLWLGV